MGKSFGWFDLERPVNSKNLTAGISNAAISLKNFFSYLHLITTQKFEHYMHTFVMRPNNTYHVDTKIHDALFDWWFHLHSLFLLFRPPAKSQSQGRGWWRPKISFPFLLFSWELLLIFPISLLSQELSTLGTYSKTWVTENFVKNSFHSWSFKMGFASQGFQLLLTISEERLRDCWSWFKFLTALLPI